MTLNNPNLSFLRNAVRQQCNFKVRNVFFGPPGICMYLYLYLHISMDLSSSEPVILTPEADGARTPIHNDVVGCELVD